MNAHYKRISMISGFLMDGFFILMGLLTLLGIQPVPRPVNAISVIVLYSVFLFLYRYVFKHNIGNGAKPLLIQSNIRFPGFITTIINYFFAIIFTFFPGYLLVICVAAATPDFSFDQWHPLIKLGMGIVLVGMLILNAVVFGLNSGHKNNKSVLTVSSKTKTAFSIWIIPIASLLAGLSIGSLQDSWTTFFNDPGLSLTLTLTSFMPFRYLVMRTGGVSRLAFLSFLAALLFSIGSALFQMYS